MDENNSILYGSIGVVAIIIAFSTSSLVFVYPVTAQTTSSISSTATSGNASETEALSFGHPLNVIFKQVQNSTVQITSKVPALNNPANPQSPQQNATALGSGFVYDKQGHIITNNHVVGDAKIVDVTFVDGNRYTAKVVGSDIYSDIAVLQIIQNTTTQQQQLQKQYQTSTLKPLHIGNSSMLEVGDQVIAVGNPFGLSGTLTTGIVSAIGRILPAAAASGFSIPNVIQTDAPIGPGSSGGPLLNIQGQVVGMSTAGIPSIVGGGIGFAIPSNTITKLVPSLIKNGTYIHPYLGLKGGTLTSDIIQNVTGLIAISPNFKGIYVDTITKNGPADKAGIHGSTTDQYSKKHVGDIIVAIDGHPAVRIDDLISYIDQHKSVGDNLSLKVYREGQMLDLKAKLTARPSPSLFQITRAAPPISPPSQSPPPLH
jgi:S1-C subfamily serine protease